MNVSVLTGIKHLSVEDWAKKRKISPSFAKTLWQCMEEPDEIPYMLDGLMSGFGKLKKPQKKEIRNALLRVQIHWSLHVSPDPIKLYNLLFIAQMLERLFFGSNKLVYGDMEEEEK
jgi:hypothetical protein